jgi:hypothetical protein
MSTDYYTVTTDFTPYTRVTSSELDVEFAALATGLALLPSQAQMDSGNTNFVVPGGTANALTVAMPVNTWTTYTGKDGSRISIRATATNTGAATLNVDSLGAKAIQDQSGNALEASAITLDGMYDLIYHESSGVFVLLTTDSAANAAAAATSAAAAAADAVSTAADVVATNADVVLTNADVLTTNADVATIQGRQTMYIPASAMWRRSTSGASRGFLETTTNKVMLATMDFDTAADEFAQFFVQMPKGWDASTVSAVFVWSHPATTTNFGVRFFIQAVALADGDAMDTAFGTAIGHTADTGGTTDDIYITPETAAITIGNTPAKSDVVIFQVYRDVSDAGDTLAVDARLHGISVFYDVDAYSDD